jgi:molybdenum cofactor guanylyltransferase
MRFSAVLLAGGRSSRMGADKALIEIDGQPLWRRQLEALRRLSPDQLLLSGPERDPVIETVRDEVVGAGPLAGISAALDRSSWPLVVVLAIDLPMMTTAFLRSLLQLCREEQGIVPQRGDYFEPLAAIYPKRCAPLAIAALQNGDFAMQNFVRAAISEELLLARTIADAEAPLFANLNTPADLAAL